MAEHLRSSYSVTSPRVWTHHIAGPPERMREDHHLAMIDPTLEGWSAEMVGDIA